MITEVCFKNRILENIVPFGCVIGKDFEFAELILSEEANVVYSETVRKLGCQFVTGYFGSGMKRISSTELKPFSILHTNC